MIRGLKKSDLDQLIKIHEKYYKDEFDFPDFYKHFINIAVVTGSDSDDIICISGIRPILEAVVMTDKGKTAREKVGALNDMLTINTFIAHHNGFSELHAFVQDPLWIDQLKRKGFVDTRGRALVFQI